MDRSKQMRYNFTSLLRNDSLAFLMIAAYLLLLAPYSLNFIFYMPDERHYVDAAMYMLKHGDYLSPVNPDGGFRFLKPIFTYWVVLASYSVFGISEFSTRFPFLLAAGVVLWLTYKITWQGFKSKETALLALLIIGASPVLHRSTPLALTDLLFLIFLQLIIYGTVGLLSGETQSKRFFWYLYAGAGMAVMTKGLPAVVFMGVALFYLLVNPWKRFRIKDIIHLPSMLAGVLLGSFWYVYIFTVHGPEAVFSFLEDQVGIRVSDKILQILLNGLSALLVVVLMMFPFMLAGWRSLFYRGQAFNRDKKLAAILGFILLWVLAMTGMAAFVSKFYYRYLIPAMPALAVGLAWLINSQHEKLGTQKLIKTGMIVAFSLFVLVNVAGVAVNRLFFGPGWYFFVFGLNIGLAVTSLAKYLRRDWLRQSVMTFLFMTGIFFALYFVIHPISSPTTGRQLADKLQEMKIGANDKIQYFGRTRIASDLRVNTKGEYFLKAWQDEEAVLLPETEVVIVEANYLDSLDFSAFDLQAASFTWKDIRPDEIMAIHSKQELQNLKEKRSDVVYIGQRKSTKK